MAVGPQLTADDLAGMLGSWRHSGESLGLSLAIAIAHMAESGRLEPEARLPAQRSLAEALAIARGTVNSAYRLLGDNGYITAEVGRGSRINSRAKHNLRRNDSHGDPLGLASTRLDLSTQSLPAVTGLALAVRSVTGSALEPYLETDGHFPFGLPALRTAIAHHLSMTGMSTTPDQILVTNGAQQAIWLTAHALSSPGDLALVENPTYRGLLSALDNVRVKVRSYDYSPDVFAPGVGPPDLDRASAVYCQPVLHSPTGQQLSPDALRGLASVAATHDLMVVEDLSTCDLLFTDAPMTHWLAALVDPARLISVGTASKLFWGGLRVGWIRADPDVVSRIADVKQSIDITTSVVDQLLAVEVLRQADKAVAERRQVLVDRLDTLTTLLTELCPTWSYAAPVGGTAMWVDTGVDAIELALRASAHGFRIADGPSFSVRGSFTTHIRLPLWRSAEESRRALELLGR